jgi:hypothetical protein
MSLLVLFRTRLEWCNYTCHYCPWNATVRKVPAEAFHADERRLRRIVDRVGALPDPVEFFITPRAEYLVLPYWRAAVGRLLARHNTQGDRLTLEISESTGVGGLDTVAEVMAGLDNVTVTPLPSMIRVDATGRMDFVYDDISEALGEEPGYFDQAEFEENMSTHYGRMVHLDDRTIMFANPEDAAEYIGFDLKSLAK